MRWLIEYIRQCFCRHEWKLIKEVNVYKDYLGTPSEYPIYTKYLYGCEKCGCLKTYKF